MELTKERIYVKCPEFYGEEAIKRHIERYKWASQYITMGSVAMDAGCGSGYGTSILSAKTSKVYGIDKSPEAIEYAMQEYALKDIIEFEIINLVDGKFITTFDFIVCIEVIEHFKIEEAKIILQKFYNTLNQKGKLILSTPNKEFSENDNTFHLQEYIIPEIYNLVSDKFKIIEMKADRFIYIVAEK